MLLARLQRQSVGRSSTAIDAHADDAAGQRPLKSRLRCNERGVRAAIAHRNTETLSGADRDVSAEFAGRHKQREREQIGCHNGQRVGSVQSFYDVTIVTNTTR